MNKQLKIILCACTYPLAIIMQIISSMLMLKKLHFAATLLILSGIIIIAADFILFKTIPAKYKVIRYILLVHGFIGIIACTAASSLILSGVIDIY